jgi:hypothetical protein
METSVSRPVLRKLLTITLACLIVTLIYFAVVSDDLLDRLIWGAFSALIVIECGLQFRQERLILVKPCAAVGTVTERSRLGGGKRGVRIRYVFHAADQKRYTGSINGSIFLPRHGHQINVLYHCDDPTNNLPRGRFWFHEVPGISSLT